MLGNGVKRIIFSIFNKDIQTNHDSTTSYKREQFSKFRHKLEECQREYSEFCGSEYILFESDISNYDNLQFEKIFKFEELADEYDEIVYLDFDMTPTKKAPNIFLEMNFNTICMFPIWRPTFIKSIKDYRELQRIKNFIHSGNEKIFDKMTMETKICAKKAMLLLEDIDGTDKVHNTGLIAGNKKIIKKLKFKKRLEEMNTLLDESKEDSLYPESITQYFNYNNEVYMSYLLERYDIPFTDLSMAWNFILDSSRPDISGSAYFYHHVNKDFQLCLEL